MAEWIDVSPESELPVGARKIINTPACEIAVFHLEDGFYAIEDVCTHDGGELASGKCEGDQIICPRHGARFCIRDGKALTPPAYEDIDSYPVRVEGGLVQVDIDQW